MDDARRIALGIAATTARAESATVVAERAK
jgi:hypothetical protein